MKLLGHLAWLAAVSLIAACSAAQTPAPAQVSPPPASTATGPAYRVPVGDSPRSGADDALVTIVEFLDYECPYCAYAHPTIESLMERYPNDIRWVIKHNPLGFHARAVPAALFAIEVHRQRGDEAFFRATESILNAERIDGPLLQGLADQHSLDPNKLGATLALGTDHPVLLEDSDLALDLEVGGTPNFFINGVEVNGAQPYAEFERVVTGELARANALIAQGVARTNVYAALQEAALPPPGLTRVQPPPVPEDAPTIGPSDAKVTIQVFSDFECPFCGRVMPTLDELRARYPDELRVVWRHLPLPFHRHALSAARAAEEAHEQAGNDGFWRMARRMLGSPTQPPEVLDQGTLLRYGDELGLERAALENAITTRLHQDDIARDMATARELEINATPGFIINGYRLVGAHPLRRFDRLIRLSLEEMDASSTNAQTTAL